MVTWASERHGDLTSEAAQAEKDEMKDEMKKLQDEHKEVGHNVTTSERQTVRPLDRRSRNA